MRSLVDADHDRAASREPLETPGRVRLRRLDG